MIKRANSPTRFDASELAYVSRGSSRAVTLKGSDNVDSNYLSSASFSYEQYDLGLKSTQQLKVDWSQFENHTFFNSATAKVNVAFDKIINGYPFDGSKKDLEKYLDDLTGYEKYVLDLFPKNRGYLFFSGSSYITVVDNQGGAFPELSKNKSGDGILDPGTDPYTVEFYLYLPPESAGAQVVFQKRLNTVGACAYIKSGSSAATAEVAWSMFSGSNGLVASATIPRNTFVHCAGVYDRELTGKNYLYINGDLVGESSNSTFFESVVTSNASSLIGSGTAFNVGSTLVTPDKTLSGALDELRIYREARNIEQIKRYRTRNVFAQDSLLLYYKFNEPTGSLSGDETSSINSIVLDSSGNGLHSSISSYSSALRSTGSISVPLSNERIELNPVIFPGYDGVTVLNSRLLTSASYYDQDNPNLITRLVPKHYLLEGQEFEGLSTEAGEIESAYGGSSIPGSGELGSTQIFLALLYTWAKFFDELKLFVGTFASLHYVDYDENDTTPDVFLPFALRQFGIKMPNLFSDAAFSQYRDGEDINSTYSVDPRSLQSVQNQIMRRVLTNMGDIIKSKGTLHGIEAFFRSIGIDPNNSFRIKEHGGPTRRSLEVSREKRLEPMQFLNFVSGGNVTSQFLSSSRREIGTPSISGTFVMGSEFPPHGISNSPSDGMWTSGSWTFEGIYRWPRAASRRAATQSLARMYVTGTSSPFECLASNLVAFSGSSPKLVLYARPGDGSTLLTSPLLAITASVDVFDGEPWHISFGRVRNDLSGTAVVSSSYFLRAAKQNYGDMAFAYSTSSLLKEAMNSSTRVIWENITTANTSGSFIRVGSSSISTGGSTFLSAQTLTPEDSRASAFDGQLQEVRFWSKALTETEWMEHARNPKSLGVVDPNVNFNFEVEMSGSWQRLRQDVSVQQSVTSSSGAGTIALFDYSQNRQHYSGSNFASASQVIVPIMVGYSYISPSIDEAVTSEKVRVRGYQDASRAAQTPWAQIAPVYEVLKSEEPQDDPRLSIEFSLVDAMNKDMMVMFATLDQLDTAIGAPENEFSSEYSGLEHLKTVYFNRMVDKLNFRAFFDFYRWFDSSVSYFVEHLVPRKTVYYGTNFVIESHLLERHKKQYFHYDMYLSEVNKPLIEDRILLQQISGIARKF